MFTGDRRFSPWKGSVVDSIIGVFLTQNVSDHLSRYNIGCLKRCACQREFENIKYNPWCFYDAAPLSCH